jgi:hypothetical protein
MKRLIEQWKNCDPKLMAHAQSLEAVQFAFEDAKADILELYKENMRLRNLARVIAYPARGTHEEGYNLMDFAKLIQSAYTAEQLYVDPDDR